MINIILVLALIFLLIIIFLPYWLATPGISKDRKMIKEMLHPWNYRYTLVLPDGFEPQKNYPLIISLHYGGHGSPFYGELFLKELVEPAFRAVGAVMVAPDCPADEWTQPESEIFLVDLISHLSKNYNLDPNRVLLIGYSMGGIGAWYFGHKFPELFSAVVIMAAKPPANLSNEDWKLPVYVIHGKKDELFSIADTTKKVVELENSGADITYRILENVSHFETHRFFPFLNHVKDWVEGIWSK